MTMKRLFSLGLALVLALGLLAGCASDNGGASDKTPEELTQLYADAINNCGVEAVQYNPVISQYDPEENPTIDMLLPMLGVTADDMSAFALSMSVMNVQAYGIAVIMPAEGCEQTVLDGVNAFVENQKSSFQTYLADQYAIAEAAKVETLADGTVVLVMCENSDQVYDAIVAALEG